MEAAGLAIGVPGLLDVLVKTTRRGYQTISDARDAPHAIMDYVQKLCIEHQRFQDWEQLTTNTITSITGRGVGDLVPHHQRRFQLIAIALGYIAQAFDEVAKLDGKHGQVETAQCSTTVPARKRRVRDHMKLFFSRSDNSTPAAATMISQHTEENKSSTPSHSSIHSLSELKVTSQLKDLNQHATSYQMSVSTLSSVKWAIIGKTTMESLYQKVKGYNDDLETLTKPLAVSLGEPIQPKYI